MAPAPLFGTAGRPFFMEMIMIQICIARHEVEQSVAAGEQRL